jgi:hypothetical protein
MKKLVFYVIFFCIANLVACLQGMKNEMVCLPDTDLSNAESCEFWNDQQRIRFAFKGNVEKYKQEFKLAFEKKDWVKQVALSAAYVASLRTEESKRTLPSQFSRTDYDLLAMAGAYIPYFILDEATFIDKNSSVQDLDHPVPESVVKKIYENAAKEGLFLAQLVGLGEKYPAALRVYCGKFPLEAIAELKKIALAGDKEGMLYYGKTLFGHSKPGTKEFLDGLSMMAKSGFLCIKTPESEKFTGYFGGEKSLFETFFNWYVRFVDRSSSCSDYKGCWFFANNVVLAPDNETANKCLGL